MKKILLLPFCLSAEERDASERMAAESGYAVVVARSTARALAEVRRHAGRGSREPVRIVGVVCDGRARKVAAGLALLKLGRWGRMALGLPSRPIALARVGIVGGTKAVFGRRDCRIGQNAADREGLRRALAGDETFMLL